MQIQQDCKKDIDALAHENSLNTRVKKLINYLKKVVDNLPDTFPEKFQTRWMQK